MKTKHLFLAIASLAIASCQSNQLDLMSERNPHPYYLNNESARQITAEVNSLEVDNILNRLFDNKATSRSNDYSISLLKDKQGNDAVICVNYGNNQGFALVSAVKTHEPILAYSDKGNFSDFENLKYPLDQWISNVIEGIEKSKELPADSLKVIKNKWRLFESSKIKDIKTLSRAYEPTPNHTFPLAYISDEEYTRLSRIIMDSINSWNRAGYRVFTIDDYNVQLANNLNLAGYVQGVIYPLYSEDYWAVTVVRESDVFREYETGMRFETQWDQENGYNQSFPFKSDDLTNRIPVGCGPVAVGQVMYAFKHPSFFDWNNMAKTGTGNKVTSDFLYDVYTKCNAKYDHKTGGTGCNIDDRIKALKNYGYSCKKITGSDVNHLSIYSGCPAIISSTLKNKDNPDGVGHAWIVEGANYFESATNVEVWTFVYENEFKCVHSEEIDLRYSTSYYINWGWYGYYDGYYDFNYLIPRDGSSYSNSLNNAIINIRPNN